jgi:hypothetical protein
MQISIRNSLAVIAIIALCIAGFVSGPPLAWVGTTILSLLLTVYAINAAVGTNGTRSFAIGLLIPASAYLLLTVFVSDSEYEISGGRLPTTQMVQSILTSKYSGKPMQLGQFSDTLRNVSDTLPLMHLSFAFVLGYAGAFYASWIYRRQTMKRG